MRKLLLLTLLLSMSAGAVSVRYNLVASFDGTRSTAFPTGNKPDPGLNDAPVWNATPNPTFQVDVAGSYSLANSANTSDPGEDASDANADALTFANVAGCTLPTGVTIDNTNDDLDYNGLGAEGTTSGCVFSVSDGIAAAVNSSAFPIVISGTEFAAMTASGGSVMDGWAGFGFNWTTRYDDGDPVAIHRVTNINASGAGSFTAALAACNASNFDVVVFETSGLADYPTDTLTPNRFCEEIAGGSAPSPGFYFRDNVLRIQGSFQHITHLAGFHGNATNQPDGKCFEINAGAGALTNVVFANLGCLFGYDGSMDLWINSAQVAMVQSQFVNPVGNGTGGNSFATLFGANDGSSTQGLFARNIMSHSNGRAPKINGPPLCTAADNVSFNAGNQFMDVDKGAVSLRCNIEGNVFVDGPNTAASLLPIIVRVEVPAITELWLSGNRVFGLNADDSTQSNLVNDDSAGNLTLLGARYDPAFPNNFVVHGVGGGTQGILDKVNLLCRHAGPRPGDAARPAHFDRQCAEIVARITGSGDQGTIITDETQHADGIPTVAVNTCDLDIADNCGTGKPALPASPTIANMRVWLQDVYCAEMNTGATGC